MGQDRTWTSRPLAAARRPEVGRGHRPTRRYRALLKAGSRRTGCGGSTWTRRGSRGAVRADAEQRRAAGLPAGAAAGGASPPVVVLDNAGRPTSKVLTAARPGLAQQGIALYDRPPYRPERNRIEPVVQQVKHHDMPVRSDTSQAALRKAVEDGFDTDRRRLQPKRDNQPRLAA